MVFLWEILTEAIIQDYKKEIYSKLYHLESLSTQKRLTIYGGLDIVFCVR